MDRAPVIGNKIVGQRARLLENMRLDQRLTNARKAIENSQPKDYPHVRKRPTSNCQSRGLRIYGHVTLQDLHQENEKFYGKLSTIHARPGTIESYRDGRPKSLNRDLWRRNLLKTALENRVIQRRLASQKPVYKLEKQLEDYEKSQVYCKIASTLPAPRGSARAKTPRRLNQTISQTEHSFWDQEKEKMSIHRRGRRIGENYYVVEVSTTKAKFRVTAENVMTPEIKVLELSKEDGERLLAVYENNSRSLINDIDIIDNYLVLPRLDELLLIEEYNKALPTLPVPQPQPMYVETNSPHPDSEFSFK
jgi:hypothetical protein